MEQTEITRNTISRPIAINILEDVKDSLSQENWQEQTLKTIKTYRKNIEISMNPTIQKLIKRYKKSFDKYGERNIMTVILGKKIDKKMRAIFTK